MGGPAGTPAVTAQIPWVVSDSTRKLFCVQEQYAVGTWGDAYVNNLPTGHHIDDFILAHAGTQFPSTDSLASAILNHFVTLSPTSNLHFYVVGYDGVQPFVFELSVAANTKKRWNVDANNAVLYNATFGGDWDIVSRLLTAQANVGWQLMNLQDAIDITRHLIRTTIDQMKFEARVPTVGGVIDTMTLTARGAQFLLRKELHI